MGVMLRCAYDDEWTEMYESQGVFTSENHDMELREKSEQLEGHPSCRNSLHLQTTP
jgi:hypothetical protein